MHTSHVNSPSLLVIYTSPSLLVIYTWVTKKNYFLRSENYDITLCDTSCWPSLHSCLYTYHESGVWVQWVIAALCNFPQKCIGWEESGLHWEDIRFWFVAGVILWQISSPISYLAPSRHDTAFTIQNGGFNFFSISM